MNGSQRRAHREDFEVALDRLTVERAGHHLLHAAASPQAPATRAPQLQRWLYSHTSTGVELACGQRGTALIVTPGQTYRLTRAKLLAIEAGVQHAELPGTPGSGHSVFWCHLFQTRAHLARSTFSPSRGLVARSLDLPGSTDLEGVGETICKELLSRNGGYERAVSGLLTYLSCLISRRIHRHSGISAAVSVFAAPADGQRQWKAVRSALGFCQEHFKEGVRRLDVAAEVGYSPSHLGYLFSTYLGYSLSDFLLTLRVAEATRLLKDFDLTVSGVASALGYSDPAHLTRAFKRAVGISPAVYRQRLKQRRPVVPGDVPSSERGQLVLPAVAWLRQPPH